MWTPLPQPFRLELTSTGAWKPIADFDGSNADQRMDILGCAAKLVDALATAGVRNVELRVTAGNPRKTLTHFDHRRGWWPHQPETLS